MAPSTRAELVAFGLLALGYRGAAAESARPFVAQAHEILGSATAPAARLLVGGALLMYLVLEGEVDAASALHSMVRRLADDEVLPAAGIAFDLASARLALLRGDSAAARGAIRRGLGRLEDAGLTFWKWSILSTACIADIGDGDAAATAETLAEMESLAARGRPLDVGNHAYAAGLAAYFDGRPDRARGHVTMALEVARRLGFPMATGLALALAARVALETGEPGAARAYLAEGLDDRRIRGFARSLLLLVEAQVELAEGNRAAARGPLREGLGRLRAGGTLSLFCMHPDRELAALCVEALREGIEVAHVGRIVSCRDLRPTAPPTAVPGWPWRVRVRVLGALETEPPMPCGPKVPRMPLALLSALAVLESRRTDPVPAPVVLDALWPDADGDRAARSLDVTLHRLRKLMGASDAIVCKGGSIGLDRFIVSVDLWDLREVLSAGSNGGDLEQLAGLYRGPLLEHVQLPFVVRERARLRAAVGDAIAAAHARAGACSPAVRRVLAADPELETPGGGRPGAMGRSVASPVSPVSPGGAR